VYSRPVNGLKKIFKSVPEILVNVSSLPEADPETVTRSGGLAPDSSGRMAARLFHYREVGGDGDILGETGGNSIKEGGGVISFVIENCNVG
jgi:hypothetical protein